MHNVGVVVLLHHALCMVGYLGVLVGLRNRNEQMETHGYCLVIVGHAVELMQVFGHAVELTGAFGGS